VESYLVSSSVASVVAQRLARRLCDRCRRPRPSDPEIIAGMGYDPAEASFTLYEAGACKSCSGTGYRGRLAITEVLLMTEEIQHMAVGRRPSDEIKKVAMAQGMRTLREDGMEKVRLGLTSLEEVLRVVV